MAVFALSQVAFYFAFKFIVGSLDPTKAKRQEAKAKSNKVLGKLGVRSLLYTGHTNTQHLTSKVHFRQRI